MNMLVPLGDLVTFAGGGTPSRSVPEYWNGSIPWATVKDLRGSYLETTEETITTHGLENSAANLVPAGTVILATRMAVGRACLSTIDVAINQDLKAAFCGPDLDPKYLFHFLNSCEEELERLGNGATVKGITLNHLSQLPVPLLPLATQHRIAAILDKADAIRRKRQQSLEQLEKYAASIFFRLFEAPESGLHNWPQVTVEDLAIAAPNSMRTGPFGSDLRHSEFTDSGIAVLGIDNAVANRFSWGERRFISEEKYAQLRRYTVYPRDVLVTIMGTVGRSAVVPDDIPTAITTKHLATITPDQNKVVSEYLAALFHHHSGVRRQLGLASRGSIMSGLNLGLIKSLRIPLPPLEIQKQYQACIGKIEESARRQEAQRAESDRLWRSLVSQFFDAG